MSRYHIDDVWKGDNRQRNDVLTMEDRGTGFLTWPSTGYCNCGERYIYSEEDAGIFCPQCDNWEPAMWIKWVEGK